MCCSENNLLDDYDECDELDCIDEQEYVYDFDEYDVDEYLAKGWQLNDEGFGRGDVETYQLRDYRTFPIRYRLKDFKLSKSLRRVLNKNRDLKTVIRPFRPTEGKDDLYTAHLHARFEKKHPRYTLRTCYDYLKYAPVSIKEACVFEGEKMVACSVFEVSEKSVYGNRGFWDTTVTTRSLGILTVLLEMQYAVEKGKEFYYLGHYFRQNPVYHYKTRFPACELYDWDNERWVDYRTDSRRVEEMFNYKFRCLDDTAEKDPEFTISLFGYATEANRRILAAALFGSRACGTAREDSDYDLILLTDDVNDFPGFDYFAKTFHRFRESKIEDFGATGKTVRAFYKNGDVYEFNFVPPSWADTNPVNDEARRIVEGGIKILYDANGVLEKLQNAVAAETTK